MIIKSPQNTRAPNSKIIVSKLNVNGRALEDANFTKFIGVLIDKNLNWDQHIKSLCTKLRTKS